MKALRLTNAQLKARSRPDLNGRFARDLQASGYRVLSHAAWLALPDPKPIGPLFVAEFLYRPERPTWDYRKTADNPFEKPHWHFNQIERPRNWRIDFAWPAGKLAIEIDGGSYVRGGHSRGPQITRDNLKRCELAVDGWSLLRVDGGTLRAGIALEFVRRAVQNRAALAP